MPRRRRTDEARWTDIIAAIRQVLQECVQFPGCGGISSPMSEYDNLEVVVYGHGSDYDLEMNGLALSDAFIGTGSASPVDIASVNGVSEESSGRPSGGVFSIGAYWGGEKQCQAGAVYCLADKDCRHTCGAGYGCATDLMTTVSMAVVFGIGKLVNEGGFRNCKTV
ncbi:MAG: hypothetical protein M1827_002741 [Pycnora praestabilis]|nr:MAG: hypothetical protein M1827_002741 [Pycnora praestabilis]